MKQLGDFSQGMSMSISRPYDEDSFGSAITGLLLSFSESICEMLMTYECLMKVLLKVLG
ncbi:hypothetical protein BVRB_7g161680 [Beta vulgaris subsp. vulgaris]|nr:hypothetical protein BVRB_7g161680 [Beta vulgaris subsp. vulgaris]